MSNSSFRRFKERPTLIFSNEIRDRIQATGQPELISDLYHAPISKTEPYHKLCSFNIKEGKRPNSDYAPCPMCTPNRYLVGILAYFPRLQAVAAIGHCCADAQTRAAADLEHDQREARDYQETLLLNELPVVPAKIAVARAAEPIAKEARRIYRQFRHQGQAMHQMLRKAVKGRDGLLTLSEAVVTQAVSEGPRSFGTVGATTEIPFGVLSGLTMFHTNWNTVRELDQVLEHLDAISRGRTADAALEFIVSMSERERIAACRALQLATDRYAKFATKLTDFVTFFDDVNLDRIDQWGAHHANPNPLKIWRFREGHRQVVVFRGLGEEAKMFIDLALWHPFERQLPAAPPS